MFSHRLSRILRTGCDAIDRQGGRCIPPSIHQNRIRALRPRRTATHPRAQCHQDCSIRTLKRLFSPIQLTGAHSIDGRAERFVLRERPAGVLIGHVREGVYENVIGLANYAAFFLPSARCSGTFSRFSMVM